MVFRCSSLLGVMLALEACGPTAEFAVSPGDDVTNLPADQAVSIVFSPGAEERLDRDDIARSLRLHTELDTAVDFSVDFSGFSPTDRTAGPVVRVVPDAPLPRGWYEAGVAAPLLVHATASTRLRDLGGAFGVRFHVGPKPVLARIRVCETGSTSFPISLALEFSEPVLWSGSLPVTVADDDDFTPPCNFVADAATGSIVAHCYDAPTFSVEVQHARVESVADPLISVEATGVTVDRSRLLMDDERCRLWRRP